MKNIWLNCLDFLKTDDAKRHLKNSLIVPMGKIMYQEMYFYVWLICFYHVFLVVLILFLVVMLLKQQYVLSTLMLNLDKVMTVVNSVSDISPI
jgi:hypothetical protein